MEKLQSFKFYVGDWKKDPALSLCSPATRGIWIDLLCAMHELDRSGQITGTITQLCRTCRCTPVEMSAALAELKSTKTAIVTERDGVVSVTCRRLSRECHARLLARKRKQKHRGKSCSKSMSRSKDGDVTRKLGVKEKVPLIPPSPLNNPLIPPISPQKENPATQGELHRSPLPEFASLPNQKKPLKPVKTHPRLMLWLEAYRQKFGRDYVVTKFGELAGAAARSITWVDDDQAWEKAIQAYFRCEDQRIRDAGYPFNWFVKELNRWVSSAIDKPTAEARFQVMLDEIKERNKRISNG